jgi:hypothetical protein
MNIRLHIERLVVDAGLAGDPRVFKAAVVAELSRALAAMPPGQAGLLQTGGSLDSLQSPMRVLHGPGPAATWGTQVGAALHASLVDTGELASPLPTARGEMR